MRRTTSLSSEMETVFTTMSLRLGKLLETWVVCFMPTYWNKGCLYSTLLVYFKCFNKLENFLSNCNTQTSIINHCDIIGTAFLVYLRVRLSKRRAKAGTQSTTNAVLVCKHRDMNEKELEAQVSTLVLSFFYLNIRSNKGWEIKFSYRRYSEPIYMDLSILVMSLIPVFYYI